MAEAALIMDMPKTCDYEECILCVIDCETEEYICAKTRENVAQYITYGKPDWCPLIACTGYVTPEGHIVSWDNKS